MLLQTMHATLCQWGIHAWEPAPGQRHVRYCARCGAAQVTLRPGGRIRVGTLELRMHVTDRTESTDQEEAR
jgi:hypothetical protein